MLQLSKFTYQERQEILSCSSNTVAAAKGAVENEVRRRGEHERRMQDNKEDVNTELSVRQVNVQEHCDKIEELNKNVLEINLAKDALEAQIETLSKTVQGLNSSVNSTQARERALERKIQLQDHSMHELEKDCEKMRSYNLQVRQSFPDLGVTKLS